MQIINYLDYLIVTSRNSIYILALVEDNGYKFVIAEVDTSNKLEANKLKSFHLLSYNLSNSVNN